MTLYGLRLLVALLTFAVGVAAAWLLNFKPAPASARGEATTVSVRLDDTPRSCSFERGRVVEGGLLQTKTIDQSSPAYPSYAKVARVSGTSVVKVEVDEDGQVVKAHALTGFGMLPEAAEKDALDTRFPVTRLSGVPVRVTGVIIYKFVLD